MKFSLPMCAVIVPLILMPTAVQVRASDHIEHTYPNHSAVLIDIPGAQANAKGIIADLIDKKKLTQDWAEAEITSTDKKIYTGNTEWVVVFFNNQADDKDKQTLYIFLSLAGEYIAVNFTGM